MAYQVYFADLQEENKALLLALLKLKEESEALESGEAELLFQLRGSETPTPLPPEEPAGRHRQDRQGGGGGGGQRRGSSRRGRSRTNGNQPSGS